MTRSPITVPQSAMKRAMKMTEAIATAHRAKKPKLVRQLVGRYLKSYDAKRVAVRKAYKALRRPGPKANVNALAAKLLPWEPSNEPARLFLKKKGTTGNYRTILDFELENRARQHLVKDAIAPTVDLHPRQYGTIGVHAAIKSVAESMAQGYVWGFEIDISNCFPSFEEERLHEFLPLPKRVIRHVIMASHLNITSGNVRDIFGPAENGVDPILVTEHLAEARQGIPQGSAVSNLVSEILLAVPFKKLPTCGVATGYADNVLLLAKNKEDAVTMMEALEADPKLS